MYCQHSNIIKSVKRSTYIHVMSGNAPPPQLSPLVESKLLLSGCFARWRKKCLHFQGKSIKNGPILAYVTGESFLTIKQLQYP